MKPIENSAVNTAYLPTFSRPTTIDSGTDSPQFHHASSADSPLNSPARQYAASLCAEDRWESIGSHVDTNFSLKTVPAGEARLSMTAAVATQILQARPHIKDLIGFRPALKDRAANIKQPWAAKLQRKFSALDAAQKVRPSLTDPTLAIYRVGCWNTEFLVHADADGRISDVQLPGPIDQAMANDRYLARAIREIVDEEGWEISLADTGTNTIDFDARKIVLNQSMHPATLATELKTMIDGIDRTSDPIEMLLKGADADAVKRYARKLNISPYKLIEKTVRETNRIEKNSIVFPEFARYHCKVDGTPVFLLAKIDKKGRIVGIRLPGSLDKNAQSDPRLETIYRELSAPKFRNTQEDRDAYMRQASSTFGMSNEGLAALAHIDTSLGTDQVGENLHRENAHALIDYHCGIRTSYRINEALRKGNAKYLSARLPTLRAITSGINEMSSYQGIVKRGLSVPIDSVLQQFVPGETVTSTSFLSTSTNDQAPFGSNVQIKIFSRTGAPLHGLSTKAKDQGEVLIGIGRSLKIESMTIKKSFCRDTPAVKIKMTEVKPPSAV